MYLGRSQADINKQQIFYDRVPVGVKIRIFGRVPKRDPNPGRELPKQEAVDRQYFVQLDDLIQGKPDNDHRWIGIDWAYIEKGGESHAREWTKEDEQRLKGDFRCLRPQARLCGRILLSRRFHSGGKPGLGCGG